MTSPLEELAGAAEEAARDQHEVARRARALDREVRRQGSLSGPLEDERKPGLLDLLRTSTQRLLNAISTFRRWVVAALWDEGLSTRQIAGRLGVSHQRISSIRRGGEDERRGP